MANSFYVLFLVALAQRSHLNTFLIEPSAELRRRLYTKFVLLLALTLTFIFVRNGPTVPFEYLLTDPPI